MGKQSKNANKTKNAKQERKKLRQDIDNITAVAKQACVGSTVSAQDSHCWILGRDGRIFDPTEDGRESTACDQIMCMMRNIDPKELAKPKYEAYTGSKLARYEAAHQAMFDANVRSYPVLIETRNRNYSIPACCFYNARCWLQDHPDSGAVLQTGKLGYRTRSGSIWWEYG